ncbi:deubiquitinase DESI2-like isoform X1 [Teleopsis dalmanni]|uniref:deubiquitinase DESI2-like isoform X1 n=1 Tax=Teleopsis dalmanni TaxID=139649 RepID=UPI0018CE6140|nr:deubiquitinase DESI2-like isoform X1 [Teleopsis dalmanni]
MKTAIRKQMVSIHEAVILNIYDLNWINGYTNTFGFGIYHTGVEVYGVEYCFGGHRWESSGIFEVPPRNEGVLGANVRLRQSIRIGTTALSEQSVKELIHAMGTIFTGNRYHLIQNNCNHFSGAFTKLLCGVDIPAWVNRLARFISNAPFLQKCIPPDWLTPHDQRPGEQEGSENHTPGPQQ